MALLTEWSAAAVNFIVLPERYYLGHRPDDIFATIHQFDLNGDSVTDITFGNSGSDLVAGTAGTNSIVHQLALPPNGRRQLPWP